VYLSGSSSSIRRLHLETVHSDIHAEIIIKYALSIKLPEERHKDLENSQAKKMNQVAFSPVAFTEQLIKVFVGNDLV
jgi:hypothetical protein